MIARIHHNTAVHYYTLQRMNENDQQESADGSIRRKVALALRSTRTIYYGRPVAHLSCVISNRATSRLYQSDTIALEERFALKDLVLSGDLRVLAAAEVVSMLSCAFTCSDICVCWLCVVRIRCVKKTEISRIFSIQCTELH